jgi:hypothetical protein
MSVAGAAAFGHLKRLEQGGVLPTPPVGEQFPGAIGGIEQLSVVGPELTQQELRVRGRLGQWATAAAAFGQRAWGHIGHAKDAVMSYALPIAYGIVPPATYAGEDALFGYGQHTLAPNVIDTPRAAAISLGLMGAMYLENRVFCQLANKTSFLADAYNTDPTSALGRLGRLGVDVLKSPIAFAGWAAKKAGESLDKEGRSPVARRVGRFALDSALTISLGAPGAVAQEKWQDRNSNKLGPEGVSLERRKRLSLVFTAEWWPTYAAVMGTYAGLEWLDKHDVPLAGAARMGMGEFFSTVGDLIDVTHTEGRVAMGALTGIMAYSAFRREYKRRHHQLALVS